AQQVADNWKQIDALYRRTEDKRMEISAFVKDLLGADVAANWSEAEADEVGFEFYLRAGFAPVYYNWISERYMNENLAACRAKLAALNQRGGEIPERGTGSHPADCWRIYDISVREAAEHVEDYRALLAGATKVDVFGDELSAFETFTFPSRPLVEQDPEEREENESSDGQALR